MVTHSVAESGIGTAVRLALLPAAAPAPNVRLLLDSPEVVALTTELDALRWVGRRGYGARAMLGACIVKALYALPTWTRVADPDR
jgi:hypothetical protein